MNTNTDMDTTDPDWGLWRSFAAVVETGSLSGAGKRLGLSQPTLGRHIEALERSLGLPLFERHLKGLAPTQEALALYEPVSRARAALAEARNRAEGRSTVLDGTVRITASTIVSHYVLPGILGPLRDRHPQIELELLASDSMENLLLREADIAIRMVRPTQLDLVARHLGDLPMGVCAHQSYIDRHGAPETFEDLAHFDLVGFDRSDLIIATAKSLGHTLKRSDFAWRTDSQTLMWEMIKSGLGIGFAQINFACTVPGMVRLLPDFNLPSLPIWLTTHRDLFTSRRIRAIYDGLAQGLAAYGLEANKIVARQNAAGRNKNGVQPQNR